MGRCGSYRDAASAYRERTTRTGDLAPSKPEIDRLLASIYTINEKLTALEDEFSFTLGEGSRWLERVHIKLLFITALTVETTGLLLTVSVSREHSEGADRQ